MVTVLRRRQENTESREHQVSGKYSRAAEAAKPAVPGSAREITVEFYGIQKFRMLKQAGPTSNRNPLDIPHGENSVKRMTGNFQLTLSSRSPNLISQRNVDADMQSLTPNPYIPNALHP